MWKEVGPNSLWLPRCSRLDCLCGLAQIHHVLEIKSDLVSMVIEHFRPPWWLLKKVKLTCGSRFSSNSSGVRTGSRGARLLTLAVVGMRYPKYPDR